MGLFKNKGKVFQQNLEEKHFGDVDCFCYDEKVAGFAPNKYAFLYV